MVDYVCKRLAETGEEEVHVHVAVTIMIVQMSTQFMSQVITLQKILM
jgi:hypothetical protein